MNMPYRPGAPLRLSYRDYKLALLAGVPQELRVAGNYWQVISTAAGAPVMLSFDESAAIQRNAGTGGPATYSAVRVSSAVDQLVTISLGQLAGPAPYDRGDLSFTGTVNVASPISTSTPTYPDVTVAAGAVAMLLPPNALRSGVLVTVGTEADAQVRFGDSSVSSTRGLPAYATDTYQTNARSAVYVFNGSSVPVTFALLETLS